MALLEDHVQWIALGLVLILLLGALLMTLRARRRSRVDAATANTEQVALEHRKAIQQNADLRERVSHLEREIQWYRGIEDKLSDTLRIAQTTATEREQRAMEESGRILLRSRREAAETVEHAHRQRDRARGEVKHLESLREELVTSYRAFVEAALELLDEETARMDRVAARGQRSPRRPAIGGNGIEEPRIGEVLSPEALATARGHGPGEDRNAERRTAEPAPTQELDLEDLPGGR
jgi:cell division initiation protein